MAPFWLQLFLILLGLLFLLITVYSIIIILHNFNKIEIPLQAKQEAIIGIVLGVIAFIFTGLIVGIYAIFAAGYDWWVATSFCSSLVGSILIILFYVIYLVGIPKEQATTSKY